MKRRERNTSTGHRQAVNALSQKTAVEESRIMQYLYAPLHGVFEASGQTPDRQIHRKTVLALCAVCGGLQCSVRTDRHS